MPAPAVLAYVFWHAPHPGEDTSAYERALAGFHAALVDAAPEGFLGAAAHAVEFAPWLPAAPVYEDWYLVESWESLGVLNEAAVDAHRRAPHDAVAVAAAAGTGGVYRLEGGVPASAAGMAAAWLDKERGIPYPEFRERLGGAVGPDGGVWERQLVLGPAPEYCVVGGDPGPDAVAAARRTVFAAIP